MPVNQAGCHAVPPAIPPSPLHSEAFGKYNALGSTRHPIPYTHVRTASNWIHQPVQQVGQLPQEPGSAPGSALPPHV